MEDRGIPTHREIQEFVIRGTTKGISHISLNNDSEDAFRMSELRLFHKVIVEGEKDILSRNALPFVAVTLFLLLFLRNHCYNIFVSLQVSYT